MLLFRLLYNVSTFNYRFRPFLFLLFVEFLGHTEEILDMSSRLPCFNIVERVDVETLHFNSGLFPFLKQYDTISRVASWISGYFLKILFVTFVFFVAIQNTCTVHLFIPCDLDIWKEYWKCTYYKIVPRLSESYIKFIYFPE